MLQHYGSQCAGAPFFTSCYGETLLLKQNLTGNYNGLLLSARHPFTNHLTSTTNFTWSHCISDNYTTTLGFFLAALAKPFDQHYDRGNCPNADTHLIFNESLVAETPNFSNRTEQLLLGHWRFSFSLIVQSGTDISPLMILDYSGSGNGLTQRPDLISNPYKGGVVMSNPTASCHVLIGQTVGGVAGTAPATVKNRQFWLNPCAFAAPDPYVFGNLKNNSLFGPGSILANTALSQAFPDWRASNG